MKHLFIKFSLVFFMAVGLFGCDEKEKVVAPGPTMDAFLSSRSDLSMFNKAINIAGLQSFKTGPGPFTWFAPTNAAFIAAGITEDSLNRMPVGKVNYMMLYHLVNASLPSDNMVAMNSTPRTTQLGSANQIYFGQVNGNTYINGTKLTSVDNRVANGYVHILPTLLTPPSFTGNIQAVINNSNDTLFKQALIKTNLWNQFATTSIYTVFAPSNQAMIDSGYTSAAIAAATGTALTALSNTMKNHYILNIRLFTNDLMKATLPATATGASIRLTSSENGTKIQGKSNASPAMITTPNILATNGVVHRVDKVLKP